MLTDKFDRPLRDLRISVTDRCNFRCTYCMPEEIFNEGYQFLVKSKLLSFEEITRLTRIIVAQGAVKLRLTGGEPLVRQDVETLVKMLAEIDGVEDIAMTTNGLLLPQKAAILKEAGVKRVTISLDSLDDTVFRQMNGGRATVEQVLAGIAAAEAADLEPIKINAVVQRNVNDHTILDLARYCKDRGYTLRFIEFMDVGTRNGWEKEHVISADEIIAMIDAEFPLEAIPRHHPSEPALRFRYRDGSAEVGVIASVTKPFCTNCTRMRLSPEGRIYTCLFAAQGTDLKTPLRAGVSDADIARLIGGVWAKRADRYSEMRSQLSQNREKIEMFYIGG